MSWTYCPRRSAVPEATPEPVAPAAKKPSETKVYQNSVDAYLIDLPPEWSDVQIIEASRSTDFLFPSKKPDTHQSLMPIEGMTNEEWEKVKTEGGPAVAPLKEIAAFGDSRYFYVLPLDQVLEGEELEQYEKLAKQIPDIIFSFRMENK